jgi:hypothetical protein
MNQEQTKESKARARDGGPLVSAARHVVYLDGAQRGAALPHDQVPAAAAGQEQVGPEGPAAEQGHLRGFAAEQAPLLGEVERAAFGACRARPAARAQAELSPLPLRPRRIAAARQAGWLRLGGEEGAQGCPEEVTQERKRQSSPQAYRAIGVQFDQWSPRYFISVNLGPTGHVP